MSMTLRRRIRQWDFVGAIFVSILINAAILSFATSMNTDRRFERVELIVMSLEAPVRQQAAPKPVVKPKEIVKPVHKPVFVMPEPAVKDEPVVEEFIPDVVEVPVSSQPVEENDVAEPSVPAQPIDTEFGRSEAPQFQYRELPEYPMMARRLGKEARVVLRLTLDEQGNLLKVEVMDEAHYGFTEAAVEAAKKSRYLPATRNGVPVPSRAILPVRFLLRDGLAKTP